MPEVVGVRFRKAGKIYYFTPSDLPINQDDHVIVETVRGVELGHVVIGKRQVCDNLVAPYLPLKEIIRIADANDLAHWEALQLKAEEAYRICLEKIQLHHLEMKLLDAEYTFDAAKLIFQFTAEGRIDFRDLVRDLAAIFRTRIELRQVGVRDEAKMIGGIGGCGRELCCCNFLGDFLPVSIKMARDQNLSLNPTKISGVCGRLLCCLNYELEEYGANSARSASVEMGSLVETGEGIGQVIYLNNKRNLSRVKLQDSGNIVEVSLDGLVVIAKDGKQADNPSQDSLTPGNPEAD